MRTLTRLHLLSFIISLLLLAVAFFSGVLYENLSSITSIIFLILFIGWFFSRSRKKSVKIATYEVLTHPFVLIIWIFLGMALLAIGIFAIFTAFSIWDILVAGLAFMLLFSGIALLWAAKNNYNEGIKLMRNDGKEEEYKKEMKYGVIIGIVIIILIIISIFALNQSFSNITFESTNIRSSINKAEGFIEIENQRSTPVNSIEIIVDKGGIKGSIICSPAIDTIPVNGVVRCYSDAIKTCSSVSMRLHFDNGVYSEIKNCPFF
jgi:uncharacterized protein (UPF0333 family)